MQRILILNAKGGCGKTTIATNLAGYFASEGRITALMDYDPQGSSMKWLSLRIADRPDIQGVAAYQRRRGVTRSFQLQLPGKVDRIIIDAPAGISGLQLIEYLQLADTVIMPVLPSPIDIHAAAHFIQDLLLIGKIRSRGIRLGIVANRVRENTLVYKDLEKFLKVLGIPLVANLRDSQNHMRAAEQGLSIHELKGNRADPDRERWDNLIQWLNEEPVRPFVNQQIS
jgi:chromosome partitioning protein